MRPTGLGVRSASVWCHEPVTKLDPDTCRHHGMSPASFRSQARKAASLFMGIPPAPYPRRDARWTWCLPIALGWMSIRRASLRVASCQIRRVKTDKADARWLAKLMRYGLLRASFIPPAEQRDLRDLTRYRTKLVQERAREVNRVQGVLERANIKLASVASDIMGVSGRAMLDAL